MDFYDEEWYENETTEQQPVVGRPKFRPSIRWLRRAERQRYRDMHEHMSGGFDKLEKRPFEFDPRICDHYMWWNQIEHEATSNMPNSADQRLESGIDDLATLADDQYRKLEALTKEIDKLRLVLESKPKVSTLKKFLHWIKSVVT